MEIAITLPRFRMRHSADGIDPVNEIGIISFAFDEKGNAGEGKLNLSLNTHIFPGVKKFTEVNMGGVGRLIYAPADPGKFVVWSLLFIEFDSDIRNLGRNLDEALKTDEAKDILSILKAIANPTQTIVVGVLNALLGLVAGILKKNKDDEVFRFEGTQLRDYPADNPYQAGKIFTSENRHIEANVQILKMNPSLAMNIEFIGSITNIA